MVVDYLSSQPDGVGYQVSTKQGSGPISLRDFGNVWKMAEVSINAANRKFSPVDDIANW